MRTVTNHLSVQPVQVPSEHGELPFVSAASAILGRLQAACGALLSAAPGPTSTCTDVESTFGLDAKLAWQVFRIATTPNLLAAGVNVPVRSSMNRLLKAAGKVGVAPDLIDQVAGAFDAFEDFARTNAEDREELDAMLRSFVPQEREKRDLANRQAAFKVMSQFKGAAMDAELSTYFLFPAADGQRVDRVLLVAELGLRRLRPGAKIGFATMSAGAQQGVTHTLDGEPSEGRWSVLLPQFCTNPLPRFEVVKTENVTSYWVAGDDVGMRTAVDLVSAEHRPGAMPRFQTPGGPVTTGVFAAPDTPTKRTTVDLFIHKDLFIDCVPTLSVYDVVPRGPVRAGDSLTRAHDQIETTDTIRQLGRGLINASLPYVPRYVEMLRHVIDKRGWQADEFRGYRLDVQYPMTGAQYLIRFDLPPGGRPPRAF